MIYLPSYFQETRKEIIHPFIEDFNFATMISPQQNGLKISHLPFILDRIKGPNGTLIAHMAKANRQWQCFDSDSETIVIFQGPHAYISPRWYATMQDNVPTWNYAVVHAYGHARKITGEPEAYDVMQRLVHHHDPEWKLDLSKKDRQEMLNEIVVFEIEVSRFEAKFKLSQNRTAADQVSVLEALSLSELQVERQAGDLMNRLINFDQDAGDE
jgi:transcriptional regulator